MSNNDNHDDNLQLFDWLLTNSMVDMTTTTLPVNNGPGNEALGNVNSFQALFDSPLPQAISLSPLQAIPTQQPTMNALTMSALTQSTFNTPPSTSIPVIHNTPCTQSISSASPDGRGSSNSGRSLSEEHVQQGHDEKASDKRRQQEDQDDHLSESELKKMTSKERRQLRNKISARKFRTRKKEYVTTLENDLQHQKHENERLNLEVSFIRANADKLQKERDDLKLQLALCREKNRELMRRLDKGGSSPSASRPPEKNNDDNRTSPSSNRPNAPNTPNTSHQNTNSLSANNKMHSLEKSLPIETAVTNATNIAPPSPPSSPQHHTHSSSKPYQQDIIVHNGDDNNNNTSPLRSNPSLVAALIWTLLGYSMTILASQDNAYHDRSLPPAPSSIEDTTRSEVQGLRRHSESNMRRFGSMTGSERLIGKNQQERKCTVLDPPSTIHHVV